MALLALVLGLTISISRCGTNEWIITPGDQWYGANSREAGDRSPGAETRTAEHIVSSAQIQFGAPIKLPRQSLVDVVKWHELSRTTPIYLPCAHTHLISDQQTQSAGSPPHLANLTSDGPRPLEHDDRPQPSTQAGTASEMNGFTTQLDRNLLPTATNSLLYWYVPSIRGYLKLKNNSKHPPPLKHFCFVIIHGQSSLIVYLLNN